MAYSKNSFLSSAKTRSFYTGLNYNNLPRIRPSVLVGVLFEKLGNFKRSYK